MLQTTECPTCHGGTGQSHPCICGVMAMPSLYQDAVISKAIQILAHRLTLTAPINVFEDQTDVLNFIKLRFSTARTVEEVGVLFFNDHKGLLAFEMMFKGSIDRCDIHVREVARAALRLNATGIIVVHNHPGGDPTPSQSDVDTTKELEASLKPLGIALFDHFILAGIDHLSMRDAEYF